MEFGLVASFTEEDIPFRTYTFKSVSSLMPVEARSKILEVWDHNLDAVQKAINYCANNDIKSYRIKSFIFPQYTKLEKHMLVTKQDVNEYLNKLKDIDTKDIIISMHPGQHVAMGSPHKKVIESSVEDLKAHIRFCKAVGCSEINIHIGSTYSDKETTTERFISNMKSYLTEKELKMITLENEELSFNIHDTIAIAKRLGVRVTYDIHHQRCHELKFDRISTEEENLIAASKTWEGYGYQRVHLSSPRDGYEVGINKARPHSEYIEHKDFPLFLLKYDKVHCDIEAKRKEVAIKDIRKYLQTKLIKKKPNSTCFYCGSSSNGYWCDKCGDLR